MYNRTLFTRHEQLVWKAFNSLKPGSVISYFMLII